MSHKKLVYVLSLIGALGSALQNFMALMDFLKDLIQILLWLHKISMNLLYGAAIVLGGLCGGVVNFCLNVELLESFFKRFVGEERKTRPTLDGWQEMRYWGGLAIFIITGILYGLTALAFGPVGVLVLFGIAAGLFVAGIMMVQEIETWLESFDDVEYNKLSLTQKFGGWLKNLTPGKVVGLAVAVLGVAGLSLMFAYGLTLFLATVGLPLLPALLVGIGVAFTAGFFTEFYFYNRFVGDYIASLKENLIAFSETKAAPVGFTLALVNAAVNGVAAYYVMTHLLPMVLLAASIAAPPLLLATAGIGMLVLGVVLMSFFLGLNFWQRSMKREKSADASQEKAVANENIKEEKNQKKKSANPSCVGFFSKMADGLSSIFKPSSKPGFAKC